MGRDLLAQDYLLKQLTASLMYPEKELGREFWQRVHKKVYELYGQREIPVNTFNKVWIVPEQAIVYERWPSAYVLKTKLKVMLEEDYQAREALGREHQDTFHARLPCLSGCGQASRLSSEALAKEEDTLHETRNQISSDIIREIIIPEIEREVNEGATFANLRQIY